MCARSAWLRTREVALLHSKDDHPRRYENRSVQHVVLSSFMQF